MAPQFTSVHTRFVVRPLLPAPRPITLPILLTNIIPEQFPVPRILTDIDDRRTPTPPPTPRPERRPASPYRAPTPARPRAPTPARPRQPTPPSREPSPLSSPLSSPPPSPDGNNAATENLSESDGIPKPTLANIRTVKALFEDCYPDLTKEEQDKKYTDFRVKYIRTSIDARLDRLCAQYLRPSVALSFPDKEKVTKVYDKMTETFPWIAQYTRHWPVAVCLQGKLHNSAARAVEKSTKKVVDAIAGVAPAKKRAKQSK
ncbi:hypothetical protein GGX14DRAFT_407359 [Mycena pura]|uniref:Uncharacterized protein n=1 Tax=Mycena pura TaxID=153505 RepID=A0AAD6URA2_9AGAR|nr:hypothetical protein GGX14DRAFT_407359 [Mycena pura]